MPRKKDKKKAMEISKKGEVYPLLSYEFPLNLQTPQVRIDEHFLGYKVKNINQLWRWDTLEDVKF
jgi:hypothetical protein